MLIGLISCCPFAANRKQEASRPGPGACRSRRSMQFHLPTMFVMVMTATVVLSASLSVAAHRRHPELMPWALALLLQLAAYVLLTLRGQIPDVLSIVVGNALVNASIATYAGGVHLFDERPVPRAVFAVPLLITVLGFSWLIDDYRGRMLLGGAVMLGQCLHLFYLLVERRRRTVGRGQYILMAAAGLYALAMVLRLVAVLTGMDRGTSLTDPTPLSTFNYLSSLACTLLLAVGALAMTLERAQHGVALSEARYRKLIDSASEGIIVLDESKVRLVNPKACAMLGLPESELLGRRFLDFIHADDQALAIQAHESRMRGRSEGVSESFRVLTHSMGPRIFQVSGVAFEWGGRPATLNFLTDITEQREAEERIRTLAFHDPLTGLPNRRLYLDRLGQAMAAHGRNGRRLGVVFLDLDNFKPLNDAHGHSVGDLLLIESARRLQANLRQNDTAARFGGDEFALILTDLDADPEVALSQARQVTAKLLELLAQPYVLETRGTTVEHRCTATAGVLVCPGGNRDRDALLQRADSAMYRAKEAGRNRAEIENLEP